MTRWIACRRGGIAVPAVCAVLALSGCDNPKSSTDHIAQQQNLEDKLAEANRQRAALSDQLAEQARTIQQLRGLDSSKRMEQLVRVDRIEIERLSGGYDDDKDGRDDGIVVYLRLFDSEGDLIKAAGSASLKLFDLGKAQDSRLLGEGHWTAEEMKPLWYGKLMTTHYTLRVPWAGGAKNPPSSTVTAVVQFTDLLTGRTFDAQKAIEVMGASQSALQPGR